MKDWKSAYAQKLRDPRWQRKRLSVLERDEWCCQVCLDDSNILSVHHRYYESGTDPWDYPDAALVTLCQSCHDYETDCSPQMARGLTQELKKAGAMSADFERLWNGFSLAKDKPLNEYDWSVISETLTRLIASRNISGEIWEKAVDDAAKDWRIRSSVKQDNLEAA